MRDAELLTPQQRAILRLKLDGYIEACVQMARLHNIGLAEALELTSQALFREMATRSVPRTIAQRTVWRAMESVMPRPVKTETSKKH